jgi:hypothetical protein
MVNPRTAVTPVTTRAPFPPGGHFTASRHTEKTSIGPARAPHTAPKAADLQWKRERLTATSRSSPVGMRQVVLSRRLADRTMRNSSAFMTTVPDRALSNVPSDSLTNCILLPARTSDHRALSTACDWARPGATTTRARTSRNRRERAPRGSAKRDGGRPGQVMRSLRQGLGPTECERCLLVRAMAAIGLPQGDPVGRLHAEAPVRPGEPAGGLARVNAFEPHEQPDYRAAKRLRGGRLQRVQRRNGRHPSRASPGAPGQARRGHLSRTTRADVLRICSRDIAEPRCESVRLCGGSLWNGGVSPGLVTGQVAGVTRETARAALRAGRHDRHVVLSPMPVHAAHRRSPSEAGRGRISRRSVRGAQARVNCDLALHRNGD